MRSPGLATAGWLAVLVAVTGWALTASTYHQFVAATAVIAAILLLSVGVVAGDAGMASLCQVAFAAVSASVMTRFSTAGHPLPVALEVVLAVAAAGLLGLVVGLPALRLRSVNLAVVTLGAGVAVQTVLTAHDAADAALIDRPPFAVSERAFLVFTIVVFALIAGTLAWIRRRPLGGSWQSVRNSERATAAMGYSVTAAKLSAFGVGAVIAGISGVLTVMLIGAADQSTFPATQSVVVFAVAVFIGGWRWQGALLAGAISAALPEIASSRGISLDWANLLFGLGAAQALAGGVCVADAVWPPRVAASAGHAGGGWEGPPSTPRTVGDGEQPALHVRGLSVRYGGVTALQDVSFTVSPGEILGLIGANGAGKTTLIDAVTGYVGYSGEVALAGTVLTRGPRARARAGLRRTFQQNRVVQALSVRRYLRLAAHRPLTLSEIDRLLAFTGIDGADVRVGELEGSARRLLEVAGALAARPAVVLLDEPVAGLSAAEALEFGRRLVHAPAVFGSAVVVVEHDVEFVRLVCRTAVALDFGRVIAGGTPESVLDDDAVRTAYLGRAEAAS